MPLVIDLLSEVVSAVVPLPCPLVSCTEQLTLGTFSQLSRLSCRSTGRSKVVHEGIRPDKQTGAILTPIVQSTTFVQDSVETYLVGTAPAELQPRTRLEAGL